MSLYNSLKNSFTGLSSSGAPVPSLPAGPYLVIGTDSTGTTYVLTKVNNNYITDNTISPAKITAGSNGQILETVAGITQWANLPASPTDFDDNVFQIYHNADNTKTIMFTVQNSTTGTNCQLLTPTLSYPSQTSWSYDSPLCMALNLFNSGVSNSVSIIPATGTASYNFQLPVNTGSPNQILQTSGGSNAITSWINPQITFPDNSFEVYNSVDNTKIMMISDTNITTGHTRILTMCDYNNDLNQFQTSSISLLNSGFATKLISGSLTSNINYTLPVTITNGFILQTNATGTLSWVNPVGLGYPISDSIFELFASSTPAALAKFHILSTTSGTQTINLPATLSSYSLDNPQVNSLQIYNSSYDVTINPAASGTSYSLYLPSAAGSPNQVIATNGAPGDLSFVNASSVVFPVSDATFEVFNSTTPSKQMTLDLSGLTASTTRVLKMSDRNYDLTNPPVNSIVVLDGSGHNTTITQPTLTSNQTMTLPTSPAANAYSNFLMDSTLGGDLQYGPIGMVVDSDFNIIHSTDNSRNVFFIVANNTTASTKYISTCSSLGTYFMDQPFLNNMALYNGSNTSDYIEFSPPPTLSSHYQMIWPLNIGTSGQVLQTDGVNTLSWQTPSSGFTPAYVYATSSTTTTGLLSWTSSLVTPVGFSISTTNITCNNTGTYVLSMRFNSVSGVTVLVEDNGSTVKTVSLPSASVTVLPLTPENIILNITATHVITISVNNTLTNSGGTAGISIIRIA